MATKLKLKIDNMMCEMCVKKVVGALEIDGVSFNPNDVKIGKAVVTYDETKVSETDIIKAVVDAGFPCTVKKGLF